MSTALGAVIIAVCFVVSVRQAYLVGKLIGWIEAIDARHAEDMTTGGDDGRGE